MVVMYLVVATDHSTTGHSVADIIQNAAARTQSKELVAVSNNQLIKRTAVIKPTWHAPWKLMRVSSSITIGVCVCACMCTVCVCVNACLHAYKCVLCVLIKDFNILMFIHKYYKVLKILQDA